MIPIRSLLAVALVSSLLSTAQATPVIGFVSARGSFELQGVRTQHTATLLAGGRLTAIEAASEVRLNSGARLLLGAGTTGVFQNDHLLLEAGQALIDNSQGYSVQAGRLRIVPQQAAAARVSSSPEAIEVAALSGSVSVRDLMGRVLADVSAGHSVQVAPAPPAEAVSVKLAGKLVVRGGKYYLTDDVTRQTYELRGSVLQSAPAGRVAVEGTAAAGDAMVINVTSVSAVAGGVSTKAVVAGVVIISGAAAGLSVGLTREEPPNSVSR